MLDLKFCSVGVDLMMPAFLDDSSCSAAADMYVQVRGSQQQCCTAMLALANPPSSLPAACPRGDVVSD